MIVCLCFAACAPVLRKDDSPAPSHENAVYIKITPQEAQYMMSDDVVILDVRSQDEFEQGHIPNAVLLPAADIRDMAETIITDKNQTILVYCRSGGRSENASRALIDMGYTSVFDFGGILDWQGEIMVIP